MARMRSRALQVATLKVMEEEGLVQNADQRGQQLRARLRDPQRQFSAIGDVRGLGLMDCARFSDRKGLGVSLRR